MNGTSSIAPSADRPLSRDLLLTLLDAAIKTDELRYARRLCAAWLSSYPGDLPINLINARAYGQEKSTELRVNAIPILEEICKRDPEYLEAQEMLAQLGQLVGSGNPLVAKACANALSHTPAAKVGNDEPLSTWAKYVHEARTALDHAESGDDQQIEKAEYFIHKALIENPETPLAAVVHLRLIEAKKSMPKLAVHSLAQIYHERWPDCLQFLLSLSNKLMESGESSYAVNLLHQAVSKDITGQVPERMWGKNHQYASLWPEILEVDYTGPNSPHSIPVPAAVASFLGWNRIVAMNSGSDHEQQSGGTSTPKPSGSIGIFPAVSVPVNIAHSASEEPVQLQLSEQAQSVQTELERLADELKRPHLAREDGRFPIYVVFTTQTGLKTQYDASTFNTIDQDLKRLVRAINGQRINQEYWGSLLFYADDPSCTQSYGLQTAPYDDAWQLKRLLSDLDSALEKRGERIGAVLIIGGPEIVPFHNLPNPVEDADNQVPSDNPYAAKDNNYFISDWPVGRISGGSGNDPSSLLSMLNDLINRYDPTAKKISWYHRMSQYIHELVRRGISKKQSSYGYSAAVWRRASYAVFQSIGNPNDLMISPPTHACESPALDLPDPLPANHIPTADQCLKLPRARLGYFNLHGVPDGSEWYGQSDPALPENGPDFPVAMRPQDIRNGGSAPRMVFSEACYGANIVGKLVDEAISLKFLSSGTHAVVGSTCISYGSLASPLSSADLLGRVFWSLLQEGFTAGESLRRAKIHLTREMHSRQGFLDAEDQKTLISFVLFGDPLAQPFHTKTSPKTIPHLSDSAVPVPTVCEHACEDEQEIPVSLETISHLKNVVSQYLPGMSDAEVSYSQERKSCSFFCNHYPAGKKCIQKKTIENGNSVYASQRRVVTFSKSFERAQHTHRQYTRVTLDEKGQIVKMVVSH